MICWSIHFDDPLWLVESLFKNELVYDEPASARTLALRKWLLARLGGDAKAEGVFIREIRLVSFRSSTGDFLMRNSFLTLLNLEVVVDVNIEFALALRKTL